MRSISRRLRAVYDPGVTGRTRSRASAPVSKASAKGSRLTPTTTSDGPSTTTLQQTIGNQAMARLVSAPVVQRDWDLAAAVSTLAKGLASLMGIGAPAFQILADVVAGVEPSVAVVRQLLEAGVSEEDATDLLLFARHPQLMGRKLGVGDEKLIAEWKSIRSGTVRPLLREIEEARDARARVPGTDTEPGEAPTPADGDFLLDTDRSYLDQIPGGAPYRDFNWHRLDFPGAKERVGNTSPERLAELRADPQIELFEERDVWYIRGANQARARRMFALLAQHVPERRANSGDDAVVTEEEFAAHEEEYDAYVVEQLEPITSQPGLRLNRHAAAAFETMRAAAAADGVRLLVGNSFRTRATAERNAARAGNRAAVAGFSSHTLGLAVDLTLQTTATAGEWTDRSTRMDNLTEMYRSPSYKWLAEHGAAEGWYPYRAEPWHWEYNPEGFRTTFFAALDASLRPTGG